MPSIGKIGNLSPLSSLSLWMVLTNYWAIAQNGVWSLICLGICNQLQQSVQFITRAISSQLFVRVMALSMSEPMFDRYPFIAHINEWPLGCCYYSKWLRPQIVREIYRQYMVSLSLFIAHECEMSEFHKFYIQIEIQFQIQLFVWWY